MPQKDAPDLRRETETYIEKAREAREVQEDRGSYKDTFRGGQQAAFADMEEFVGIHKGRDPRNILQEIDAYIAYRRRGGRRPDSPRPFPRPRYSRAAYGETVIERPDPKIHGGGTPCSEADVEPQSEPVPTTPGGEGQDDPGATGGGDGSLAQ